MSFTHDSTDPAAYEPATPHTCGVCARSVPQGADFCPWCGASSAETVDQAQVSEPQQSKRGARIALIAVAAVTALALVATAAWLFLVPSAADKQLAAATTALDAAAASLSTAGSTAAIRSAGAAAAEPASTVETFLNGIAEEKRPAELVVVSSALTAVASLKDVSGEAASAWDSAQGALRTAAGAQLAVEGLGASLTTAADNTDRIVKDAVSRFQTWQAENAAAIAARDEAIAKAQRYQSAMQGSIDDYNALRNDLGDYMTRVDNGESSLLEAYYVFNDAAAARRDVRDDMAKLNPPAAADAAHSRLISVISDGIAGVESAQRSLDYTYCDYYDYACYAGADSAWQNFRSESKRITGALDDAVAAWKSGTEKAVADAQAMPLPAKPEV